MELYQHWFLSDHECLQIIEDDFSGRVLMKAKHKAIHRLLELFWLSETTLK